MITPLSEQTLIPHTNEPPGLYIPDKVIPIPKNGNSVTNNQSLLKFFSAFLVLVVLVYALPPKYGIWVPAIVLLGYGANRTTVITQILESIQKYTNDFYKG